jgi:phosphate starvation-inducible PhoH-like protein
MAKRKRPVNQELESFHEMPRRFRPKNEAQSRLWDVIGQHTVTFVLGPAGTAKTYVATSWAVNAVEEGHFHRIVMTRPVVEATESLGFLPGDIASKVQPYMRPMTDTVAKIKAKEPVIDTIPLAFMRGITLEHCVGLLDEAQNCNVAQLKLYLTRLGDNAKLIISGDTDQVDVNDSGLLQVAERLRGLPGVGVFEFTKADIVRHPLVGAMLDRF